MKIQLYQTVVRILLTVKKILAIRAYDLGSKHDPAKFFFYFLHQTICLNGINVQKRILHCHCAKTLHS